MPRVRTSREPAPSGTIDGVMPVDPTALLKGLKPVVKALDADLLKRAGDPGVEQLATD